MNDYASFLVGKRAHHQPDGIVCGELHPSLFPHQRDIVQWACRLGRAAVFADTGLGKTRIMAEWCRNIVEQERCKALILAPLAVSEQTIAECRSIGIDAGGADKPVHVTNYEKLHRLDPASYGAVVLDESSILKSFNGLTRTRLIEAFREYRFRLACTATPAPNDHTELGNHAEFLGICTYQEMLAEFFVHDSSSSSARGWRLKGHAVREFWRWVASWAVVLRMPSDLGHDDDSFVLPDLIVQPHLVAYDDADHRQDGALFAVPANGLAEQRTVRKSTLASRVAAAASLVGPEPDEQWLVWCEYNAESEAMTKLIPGAVEVTGSDDEEDKAANLLRFARGDVRVLVTKPSIAGFGMNWQACARVVFVGVSHSYEMFYQAVRRCWRFGQRRPVSVWLIQTALDGAVADNLKRKAESADAMAEQMLSLIRDHQNVNVHGASRRTSPDHTQSVVFPGWLVGEETDSCRALTR